MDINVRKFVGGSRVFGFFLERSEAFGDNTRRNDDMLSAHEHKPEGICRGFESFDSLLERSEAFGGNTRPYDDDDDDVLSVHEHEVEEFEPCERDRGI